MSSSWPADAKSRRESSQPRNQKFSEWGSGTCSWMRDDDIDGKLRESLHVLFALYVSVDEIDNPFKELCQHIRGRFGQMPWDLPCNDLLVDSHFLRTQNGGTQVGKSFLQRRWFKIQLRLANYMITVADAISPELPSVACIGVSRWYFLSDATTPLLYYVDPSSLVVCQNPSRPCVVGELLESWKRIENF
jgi:hypothetical protein